MAFDSNSIPLNDPQVHRQITEMGRFTRDVRHISGVDNVFADFLSRIEPKKVGTAYLEDIDDESCLPEVASTESVRLQINSLPALADLQSSCEEINLIKSGNKPKKAEFDTVDFDGHKIFCEISSDRKPRPYVPEEMRMQIMTSLHQMDHKGISTTLQRIGG